MLKDVPRPVVLTTLEKGWSFKDYRKDGGPGSGPQKGGGSGRTEIKITSKSADPKGKTDTKHRAGRALAQFNRFKDLQKKIASAKTPEEKTKHEKVAAKVIKLIERETKAAHQYAKTDEEKGYAEAASVLLNTVKGGKAPEKEESVASLKAEIASVKANLSKLEDAEDDLEDEGEQSYEEQKKAELKAEKETEKHLAEQAAAKKPTSWAEIQAAASEIRKAKEEKRAARLAAETPEQTEARERDIAEKTAAFQVAKPVSLDKFKEEKAELLTKLSLVEKAVALDYSGGLYQPLNKGLRSETIPAHSYLHDNARSLDAIMEKTEFKEDAILYRGMNGKEFFDGRGPGDMYVDKGFMSTSIDKGKAFSGEVQLYIHVPKGSKGAAIPSNSSREMEVLLPRNQKIEILEIRRSNAGQMIVHARVHQS